MPCKNLRGQQLSLYVSGDLDETQSRVVSDHLKVCPACRLGVQSFERTRSLLGSYSQQISRRPEGPSLWSGVMGRMNQKPVRGGRLQPPPQA
jgi:anti-sigma factor RsiW